MTDGQQQLPLSFQHGFDLLSHVINTISQALKFKAVLHLDRVIQIPLTDMLYTFSDGINRFQAGSD